MCRAALLPHMREACNTGNLKGMEKECRFGHICASGCGNDFDCPCQADHCCALTEGCEGPEHCDDHYVEMSERETKIKEMFEMVYQWGRVGVQADFECNAFRKALKDIISLSQK